MNESIGHDVRNTSTWMDTLIARRHLVTIGTEVRNSVTLDDINQSTVEFLFKGKVNLRKFRRRLSGLNKYCLLSRPINIITSTGS